MKPSMASMFMLISWRIGGLSSDIEGGFETFQPFIIPSHTSSSLERNCRVLFMAAMRAWRPMALTSFKADTTEGSISPDSTCISSNLKASSSQGKTSSSGHSAGALLKDASTSYILHRCPA